jgi:hypothetical protein
VSDVEEIEEEVEAPITVLEFGRSWPLEDLPRSPKGLMREVLADGWEAVAQRSLARHGEVLYKSASKPDAKKKHNAGDVRSAAADVEHFGIQGMRGEVAKFWATWDRVGGKTTKFVGAMIWDLTGNYYFETTAGGFEEWRMLFRPAAERPAPRPEKPEVAELATEFTMEEAA